VHAVRHLPETLLTCSRISLSDAAF